MRNIALKLMYNGTAYHGWQVQKNAVTVCETLQKALEKITGAPVHLTGCGRTDAGVHAERYIANFRTESRIPLERLPFAINTHTPEDIAVSEALEVAEDFNAIGSCLKKEYTYRIYNSRVKNPFYVNRAYFYPKRLDEEFLNQAAHQFVGTHDFAAVRSVGTETKTTVRTIYWCDVTRSGELLELKVCADGFLYNMVRAITGTVLYAAEGKFLPEDIPAILESRDRTLAGPTVRFTTNTCFAITGGDFAPTLDGEPVPMYAAVMVRRGSILRFKASRTGCYGYLAIAGNSVRVPEVMGSRSTNLKCEFGGWKGRTLIVGDYLPFSTKSVDFLPNLGSHRIDGDNEFYGFDRDEITVRVVPGPQQDMFTDKGLATFYGQAYTTTTKCDRMGYRLDGPEIETKHGSDIISDGVAFGAVQVPSHGRPIIMLADRQTTGGYAKIGTIASVDIPKLVQRPPGGKIRFESIGVQEAQALLREEAHLFEMLALKVRRPSADGISPRRTARRLTPILEEQARKSQADMLWIDRADRSQRVGNRNALGTVPPKKQPPDATDTTERATT